MLKTLPDNHYNLCILSAEWQYIKLTQKSVSLLYTNDKQNNQENNFIHSSLKEFDRINTTTEVKDLYNENFKTVNKEILEDTIRLKNLPCPWICKIIIIKMIIIPKAICRINIISVKTATSFFAKVENKTIQNLHENTTFHIKQSQIIRTVLEMQCYLDLIDSRTERELIFFNVMALSMLNVL